MDGTPWAPRDQEIRGLFHDSATGAGFSRTLDFSVTFFFRFMSLVPKMSFIRFQTRPLLRSINVMTKQNYEGRFPWDSSIPEMVQSEAVYSSCANRGQFQRNFRYKQEQTHRRRQRVALFSVRFVRLDSSDSRAVLCELGLSSSRYGPGLDLWLT